MRRHLRLSHASHLDACQVLKHTRALLFVILGHSHRIILSNPAPYSGAMRQPKDDFLARRRRLKFKSLSYLYLATHFFLASGSAGRLQVKTNPPCAASFTKSKRKENGMRKMWMGFYCQLPGIGRGGEKKGTRLTPRPLFRESVRS